MTKTIDRSFVLPKTTWDPPATQTEGGGGGAWGGVREPWNRNPVVPPPGGTDRILLLWMLNAIEDELYRFVFGRTGAFPGAWRDDFQPLWPAIAERFEAARATLTDWKPGSLRDPLQERLALAGLTGETLKVKALRLNAYTNVFRQSLGELSIIDPQPRPAGFFEKMKDLVFGTLNTLLGSLAKAFPPLEAVQEYKEHVELAIKAVEIGAAE